MKGRLASWADVCAFTLSPERASKHAAMLQKCVDLILYILIMYISLLFMSKNNDLHSAKVIKKLETSKYGSNKMTKKDPNYSCSSLVRWRLSTLPR